MPAPRGEPMSRPAARRRNEFFCEEVFCTPTAGGWARDFASCEIILTGAEPAAARHERSYLFCGAPPARHRRRVALHLASAARGGYMSEITRDARFPGVRLWRTMPAPPPVKLSIAATNGKPRGGDRPRWGAAAAARVNTAAVGEPRDDLVDRGIVRLRRSREWGAVVRVTVGRRTRERRSFVARGGSTHLGRAAESGRRVWGWIERVAHLQYRVHGARSGSTPAWEADPVARAERSGPAGRRRF